MEMEDLNSNWKRFINKNELDLNETKNRFEKVNNNVIKEINKINENFIKVI